MEYNRSNSQTGDKQRTEHTGDSEPQDLMPEVPGPAGLWIRGSQEIVASISDNATAASSFFLGGPQLVVSASAHSNIQVSGLGWFVRADECLVHNTSGVIAANDCTLKSVDHYHVRRASLSMDELLSAIDKEALRRLVEKPDDRSAALEFQQQLRQLTNPPAAEHATQVSIPLARKYRTTIDECDVLQVGDHSRMKIVNRFVVDETVLPAVDLLARSTDLIELFARALKEPESGGAMRNFLRAAMKEAKCGDDLELIRNACGLEEVSDPWLSVFFGIATTTDMKTVMAGAGNTSVQITEVCAPGIVDTRGVFEDFNRLRSELDLPEPAPPPEPVPSKAAKLAMAMHHQIASIRQPPTPSSDPEPSPGPRLGFHL